MLPLHNCYLLVIREFTSSLITNRRRIYNAWTDDGQENCRNRARLIVHSLLVPLELLRRNILSLCYHIVPIVNHNQKQKHKAQIKNI